MLGADPVVELLRGDEPELGAQYDVTVKSVGRPLVLRYELTAFEAPRLLVARAESRWLTSLDRITITPDDGADEAEDDNDSRSIVTYDAELTLNGPLGLADPLLAKGFTGIGDRAAAGLIRALDGRRTERVGDRP